MERNQRRKNEDQPARTPECSQEEVEGVART